MQDLPPVTNGDGDLHYTVEMTADRLDALTRELDAALWLQNERLYERWRSRMRWRPQLRVAGLVLATVGFLLALLGAAFSVRLRVEFGALGIIFALFFIVFLRIEALGQLLRRGTRRLIARNARRAMAQVRRRVPYTVEYTLTDGQVRIRSEKLGLSAGVALSQVRVAVVAASLICVFARSFAQRPIRILYVPGPEERLRLESALVAAGADLLNCR